MGAWSQLPNDVWCFIGKKLHVTADRIRFRSVCKTWRCALPLPQPPWLMLAEDESAPNTRGFFGLGTLKEEEEDQQQQEVYQFELPEVFRVRCVGSTGTWLITVDLQQRIRLLNPFSRLEIHLPPLSTLEHVDVDTEPKILRDCFVIKMLLSSTPSNGRDCIAMAIYQFRKVAIAKPGDASWTSVVLPPKTALSDIIFYRDQFYGITIHGTLVVFHLGDPPQTNMLTSGRFKNVSTNGNVKYLVEWMGELLLVIKFMINGDFLEDPSLADDNTKVYHLDRFEVYKFDFESKNWNELNNLGDYSLFLGLSTSLSVLTSHYPGLKKNCIYFTDDYIFGYRGQGIPGGREMGVFDLEANCVGLHYKGTSTSFYSPPIWIVPRIHLPSSTTSEVS